ncbi:hypothetical protein EBX93_02580 [bacterium]|nr:hypothetical protein [bacterium]
MISHLNQTNFTCKTTLAYIDSLFGNSLKQTLVIPHIQKRELFQGDHEKQIPKLSLKFKQSFIRGYREFESGAQRFNCG